MRYAFASVAVLLAACGGGSGGRPPATASRDALVATSAEPPGANCLAGGSAVHAGVDTNGNGVLDASEVTSTVYVCNGVAGLAGASGAAALVTTSTEPAGLHCASGGVALRSGVDANGNGTLDAAEVQQTSYTCNGAAGSAGADGLTTLVAFVAEPAGTHCAAGGTAVDAGADANRNGVLDAAEVQQVSYVCNGAVPAPLPGTVSGTVTDAILHDALPGVAVTARSWGGATAGAATTDATGKFTLSVPAGDFVLSFASVAFTSPGDLAVSVGAGQAVTANATMSESASGAPSVSVSAPAAHPGYGATVALTASATDPNGDALTYAWSNASSPVLGAVTGAGAAGSVTLPTMAEAFAERVDLANPGQFVSGYALEDRFGILPVFGDTRGEVTATVTVRDGRGQSASASLSVDAASVVPGVHDVAIGTRVYLNSGHAGANAWAITAAPSGSTAALDDPTSRTPSLVLDLSGTYTVSEGGGATGTVTLFAGDWQGAITGGSGDAVMVDPTCMLCHGNVGIATDPFTPWLQTRHASSFARALNGQAAGYAASCIACHAVGFDPGVVNGGFDDAAAAAGWTLPATLAPQRWGELVASAPTVARLANVQCESCHGPQLSSSHMSTRQFDGSDNPFLSARISYASEACAGCHGAGERHIYSEWATSGPVDASSGAAMSHASRTAAAYGASATTLNASCGRCHTAQGYTLYVDLLRQGKVTLGSVPATVMTSVTTANVEPVTCAACHDPHDATNPAQLRVYGDTPLLPSGFAAYGMGKGALCVTCHNSRLGAQTASDALTYLHEDGEPYNAGNPTGYSLPHEASQGDVFVGRNAYFMGASLPMTSGHAAVQDTCVGCHMTLQPKGFVAGGAAKASGHLFRVAPEDEAALCARCHGPAVDGQGTQAQVEAQLAALAGKLALAAKTKLNGVSGGILHVRAHDDASDLYSSTNAANVVIDVTSDPITSVALQQAYASAHGQLALVLSLASPITIQFVDATGVPVGPPKQLSSFTVQLGSLKDGQATPQPLYGLGGNFVRAGWNYFLVAHDRSMGIHNPSFVTAVLNATMQKDVSN